MKLVELDRLTDAARAELYDGEVEPFGEDEPPLQWQPKSLYLALQGPDGRLVATAGLLVAELEGADRAIAPVVGIGGVIVTRRRRGEGLAKTVIDAALERAAALGPDKALLFCRPDRAGLYEKHGFAEVPGGPITVEQPGGAVAMPDVAMWRPLRAGAQLPPAPLRLRGLPF